MSVLRCRCPEKSGAIPPLFSQQLNVLTDVPDVAHIAGVNLSGLRKKRFDAHNEELHAHLLDQHRPGALSQPERAALRSTSSGLGSAWLSAMPVMPTLRLTDYAVTFALRTRLTLPACRSTDKLPSAPVTTPSLMQPPMHWAADLAATCAALATPFYFTRAAHRIQSWLRHGDGAATGTPHPS